MASDNGSLARQEVDYFSPELIFLDRDYADTGAFFSATAAVLQRQGYVRDTFLSAITRREAGHPTGLPTSPWAIALPHTDPEHILRPFISVTRLARPIAWREMGNPDRVLQAYLVIMLGFVDSSSHLQVLQALMESLTDEAFLRQLYAVPTPEDFLYALKNKLHNRNIK